MSPPCHSGPPLAATPLQAPHTLAEQPGTSALHAWQAQLAQQPLHLKGQAAAAAGGHLLRGATDEALLALIGSTRDPVLRHVCLIKHSRCCLGRLLPRLGLEARGGSSLGCNSIVQGLLGLVLQLLGCPSLPDSGGAWQRLLTKLQQEQEELAAAGGAAGTPKCWLPSRTAIRQLLGCSQQRGTKPNLPGSRGYIMLHTVKWAEPGSGCKATSRTLHAHQLMCWAVHGPPPQEDEAASSQQQQTWVVRHLCGKPGCLRPGCLAWGTHKQNAQDMAAHREWAKLKGVCSRHRVVLGQGQVAVQ